MGPLQAIAARCHSAGDFHRRQRGRDRDRAEMPEMDGYVLTRNVKSDRRFAGFPYAMHSSLSSRANHAMGRRGRGCLCREI